MQTRVCDVAERWRAARAAAMAEAVLTLLDAVRREYEAAKRARGVLDYDDLILATRNLLARDGAAQWVLYKLDNGIDHVLVDEAQDTSPEQWDILKRLTGDFFSGESNAKVTRTVFAVGDEKQSIFSFQGADPAQFAVNREHFAGLAGAAGLAFLDQPLITSRRSAPEILAFVDKVFESETAREGLTFGNAPLKHLRPSQRGEGRHRSLATAEAGRRSGTRYLSPGGCARQRQPGGAAGGEDREPHQELAGHGRRPARP